MNVHNDKPTSIVVSAPTSDIPTPEVNQSPITQAALPQLSLNEITREVRSLESRMLVTLNEVIEIIKSGNRTQSVTKWAAIACLVTGLAFFGCSIGISSWFIPAATVSMVAAAVFYVCYLSTLLGRDHADAKTKLVQNYLDGFFGFQRYSESGYTLTNIARSQAKDRIIVWEDRNEDERSQCIIEAMQREQKFIAEHFKTILESEEKLSYLKHQSQKAGRITLAELIFDPNLADKASFSAVVSGLITYNPSSIVFDFCVGESQPYIRNKGYR